MIDLKKLEEQRAFWKGVKEGTIPEPKVVEFVTPAEFRAMREHKKATDHCHWPLCGSSLRKANKTGLCFRHGGPTKL